MENQSGFEYQSPPFHIPQNQRKFKLIYLILPLIAVIFAVFLFGSVFYLSIRGQEPSISPSSSLAPSQEINNNETKSKKIILYHRSNGENSFHVYDYISNEKKALLSLDPNIIVNEIGISHNGITLYYVPSEYNNLPSKIIFVDAQKNSKEADFAKSGLWTLSHISNPASTFDRNCYWSYDNKEMTGCFYFRQ